MDIDREKIRMMLNEYLDGELTPPQAEEVSAAIAGDAELSREYAELLALRKAVGSLRGVAAPHDMADRIMLAANHHAFPMHERTQSAGGFGKLFRVQMFAAAAVVLVAVGMGLYILNTISKSQEPQQAVAIEYPKSKALADEESARRLDEAPGFARPAAAPAPAIPAMAEKLSKSRPVSARITTRENIDKLEGKVLPSDVVDNKPVEDLTPTISPEPSLAMDDDASGHIGSDVSEYEEPDMVPEDAEENKSVVMAPPVLQAPKSVSTVRSGFEPGRKKVNVFGSRVKELPAEKVGQVIAKTETMSAFEAKSVSAADVTKKPDAGNPAPPAAFTPAKPETPATPETPAACAEPVTVATVSEKEKSKFAETVPPCKPTMPAECELAVPAAPEVAPCGKMSVVAVAKKDVEKSIDAPAAPELKKIAPARSQDILIETANVGETQAKLESYMKSNNIQVVSSQQLPADVSRVRKEELNAYIQKSNKWADKEPITLHYNIRTSQRQADQLNVDLAKQFPNVRNVQQSPVRLAASVESNDGRSNVSDTKYFSNTVDANPVFMVITIQQRPMVCATTVITPTTKPASAPASQPSTQPAK